VSIEIRFPLLPKLMTKLLLALFLTTTLFAQDHRPRLELEPDLNLNGGGFQPLSVSMAGGMGMENTHSNWHVRGIYDSARKVNDGTPGNRHGNIRVLSGDLCGRFKNAWLVCSYAAYANLRTTNYTKNAVSAAVGIGHDWFDVSCSNCNRGSFSSMRLVVLYGLPLDTIRGRSDADKEHAIQARFTIPSPIETDRRVFFNMSTSGGWIRTSSTGHYGHDASSSFGVLFRF
jgi:hypothetical protein